MARYAANWRLYSVSGYVSLLRTVIPQGYIGVLLLYAALIVLFSQQHGLYHTPRDRSQLQETFLVAKALSWSTAMLMATHISLRLENDFSARDPCERCYERRRSRFLEYVEMQHHRTTCGSGDWHPQRSNRRGGENRQGACRVFRHEPAPGCRRQEVWTTTTLGVPESWGGSRISPRSVGCTLWMKLSSPCRSCTRRYGEPSFRRG